MSERVVLCHGVFDLLHAGHVEHLQQARAMGDRLIVSVTADDQIAGRTPMLSQDERMANLRNLPCVDVIMLALGRTAHESILQVRPAVYAKGPDYQDAILDPTGEIEGERTFVESVGGAIAYTSGPTLSSTYLRARQTGTIDDKAHDALEEIRDHVTLEDLAASLHRLADAKFVIIGDPIIDVYISCTMLGHSMKSPTLSLREQGREHHAGGAWANAKHMASLVPRTKALPAISDAPDPRIPRKIRMFDQSSGLTMLSLCAAFEEEDLSAMLAEGDLERIDEYDAVLVADFGHGLMHERARHQIESRARWLASMVQANSVNGGRARYLRYAHNRRPNYMCQDCREIANVLAPDIMASPNWARAYAAESEEAAVTLGHEGSLQLTREAMVIVPALADHIVDITGTGDAYYAASAAFSWACGGRNPWISGLAGAVAAAIHCRVRGNASPIARSDFVRMMRSILMHRPKTIK